MNKLDEPVVIEGKFDYIAGKKVEVKTHYQLRETKKKELIPIPDKINVSVQLDDIFK